MKLDQDNMLMFDVLVSSKNIKLILTTSLWFVNTHSFSPPSLVDSLPHKASCAPQRFTEFVIDLSHRGIYKRWLALT